MREHAAQAKGAGYPPPYSQGLRDLESSIELHHGPKEFS